MPLCILSLFILDPDTPPWFSLNHLFRPKIRTNKSLYFWVLLKHVRSCVSVKNESASISRHISKEHWRGSRNRSTRLFNRVDPPRNEVRIDVVNLALLDRAVF